MRNEEHIHLHLIPGLGELVGPARSFLVSSQQATERTTFMPLGEFFGRMGDAVDNVVGSSQSVNHRRVRCDRDDVLMALDDPIEFILSRWPEARHSRRAISGMSVALRASLLERLGLLTTPNGWSVVPTPTLVVGEAFSEGNEDPSMVFLAALRERMRYASTETMERALTSFAPLMSQRVPADLLAAYWQRYREHFIVAEVANSDIRGFVMSQGLDGLIFGPNIAMAQYLHEPTLVASPIAASSLSSATITASPMAYAGMAAEIARLMNERIIAMGAPPVPMAPDKKHTAKRAKLSVLLRPTRTVFGIPVQVESDGSEIFVKPRTEGGK